MPKKTKPRTFGDACRRCLITSIDSYEECEDGVLRIFKKSGKSMDMHFGVDYLLMAAMDKLDTYFSIDAPASDPCAVCIRKDVNDPDYESDWSYCNGCKEGEIEFYNFRPPGAELHDKEETNE